MYFIHLLSHTSARGLLSEKADILISHGNFEEALSCLDKARAIDPNDQVVAVTQDQLNRERRRSRRVASSTPQSTLMQMLMPVEKGSENYTANLWELVNNDDRNIEFWLTKAGELKDQHKYSEALQACDEAIKLDEWFAPTWFQRGIVFGDMGRFSEAVSCLKFSTELDPQKAEYWFFYGIALLEEKRYSKAIDVFDRAKQLGHPKAEELRKQTKRTSVHKSIFAKFNRV